MVNYMEATEDHPHAGFWICLMPLLSVTDAFMEMSSSTIYKRDLHIIHRHWTPLCYDVDSSVCYADSSVCYGDLAVCYGSKRTLNP